MSRPIAANAKPKPVKGAEWKLELCQLGKFKSSMSDSKGRYDPRNCNKPAVAIVAGCQICVGCLSRLNAIVEASKANEGHRTPVIEHTELLRRSA